MPELGLYKNATFSTKRTDSLHPPKSVIGDDRVLKARSFSLSTAWGSWRLGNLQVECLDSRIKARILLHRSLLCICSFRMQLVAPLVHHSFAIVNEHAFCKITHHWYGEAIAQATQVVEDTQIRGQPSQPIWMFGSD